MATLIRSACRGSCLMHYDPSTSAWKRSVPRRRVRAGTASITVFVAVAAFASHPSPGSAQIATADSAAAVLQSAQTFEARDQWEIAEALYRYIQERFPATPAATAARARLASPPELVVFGDGRTEVQVWSTLYGAWLGIAIPGALGADEPEPFGIGLLVGGPVGFLAGRGIARSRNPTEGQAAAVSHGAWWGTWQGLGWQDVFELGVGEQCDVFGDGTEHCYETEDSTEEQFAAMLIGGAVGLGVGLALSGRNIAPGTGTMVSLSSLWGTWFGVAGGVLLDLEGDDLLAAALLVGNAGLVSAALFAPGWNVTRSRARLVSIAGLAGGIAGAGIDLLIQPEDEKLGIAIPLIGSIAGLALGVNATRGGSAGDQPPEEEATLGGALFGLRDGRLVLDAPIPTPTLVPWAGRGRTTWRPALRFELFRARF